MKVARTVRTIVASAVVLLAGAGIGISNATAGWVFIGDVNAGDSATNPGYPGNQNEDTVAAYLQDLLDLPSAPTNLVVGDNYGGGALTGLGEPVAPDSLFLAFHFGNGNNYWVHTGNFDVFFSCATGCDAFSLPDTKGVSNYRLYGPTGETTHTQQEVPEPMTAALLGLGFAGIALARRRT